MSSGIPIIVNMDFGPIETNLSSAFTDIDANLCQVDKNVNVSVITESDIDLNLYPTDKCVEIPLSSNAVEIPISDAAFALLMERFFSNPNFVCVFDSGNAATIQQYLQNSKEV